MMTREEAENHLKCLYELQEPYRSRVIDDMGFSAFSDAAIIRLANLQLEHERKLSLFLDRVDAYHRAHPYLSWRECENNLRTGLR